VKGERNPLPMGPIEGAAAQLAVLVLLWIGVGFGPAGWLAGAAYGVIMLGLLANALLRTRTKALGPADHVTLARATMVGGVTALVADSFWQETPITVLVVLASVTLTLDAVDGQVARRSGTVSPFGARFDMEVDAFLILVLSVFVATAQGWWVLAIGGMRYLFVAAAWVLPWMTAPLPPSIARKTVAAVQGVALVVAASGVLPEVAAMATTGLALASLLWSFGRDTSWLYRQHRRQLVDAAASISQRTPDRV
jgi:phosphatidylglycerophosphate synthase